MENNYSKFIVWKDLGYDGWNPHDFDSLEKMKEYLEKYPPTKSEPVIITEQVKI